MIYFWQIFNTNLNKKIQIKFEKFLKYFFEEFFCEYFKNIPQKVIT